jgi:hypothetical protein
MELHKKNLVPKHAFVWHYLGAMRVKGFTPSPKAKRLSDRKGGSCLFTENRDRLLFSTKNSICNRIKEIAFASRPATL